MNLEEQFGRLIHIARLIKKKPEYWDAAGLAVELGVSEPTIHRDIRILKHYGQVRKPRGKGYVIDNFALPLEQLDFEEVLALTLAGKFLARQSGTPYADAISSALRKISGQLSDDLEESLERMEDRISVAVTVTKDYSRHGRIFASLNRAIARHHPIIITYFTMRSQTLSERRVDPYCITFRRSAWYLIGLCHKREAIRTFGIQRIRKVKVLTNEHFRLPPDFSVEKYLAGSWQLIVDGAPRHVVIRFTPEVAPYILESKWHPTQRLTPLPDGGALFEADISGTLEIKRWVLSYGGCAEVLEPRELREEIARDVRALAARYADIIPVPKPSQIITR